MRFTFGLAASLVAITATAPALASSCSEQIATIERRLDSAGAASVTGTVPPGGPTTSHSDKALAAPPPGKATDPAARPSSSGVGEAHDLIKTAKAQDAAGDASGCEATMTKAKQKAGALP